MDNTSTNEPTVEELVTKALAAEVIDQEFAGDLRSSADLEEALSAFYAYIIEGAATPDLCSPSGESSSSIYSLPNTITPLCCLKLHVSFAA